MSPVLNIHILQRLLLIVPNPLKQRTNLFFNLIILWFGCHACRFEMFYSNWTSCNGSSTSNRAEICSTKKIVAEVNVPSYPVISFIIFYQVKKESMHPSESYRVEQFYSSNWIPYHILIFSVRDITTCALFEWYLLSSDILFYLLSSEIFYSSCTLWACNGSSTSNLTEICSMHIRLLDCSIV